LKEVEMPGLVRGMVRTAAVAGTATATRNAVNRRQADRNVAAYSDAVDHSQAEHVQAPPPPPPAPEEDTISKLERLGALHTQGILTDEEFAAEKAKLLNI
jgi:hypothetical protein